MVPSYPEWKQKMEKQERFEARLMRAIIAVAFGLIGWSVSSAILRWLQ